MMLTVLFLSASFFLANPVYQEVMRTVELRTQLARIEDELMTLEAENATLQDQRTKLLDPDYVKSYARANYMLTKEGEQIYYLPKADEND